MGMIGNSLAQGLVSGANIVDGTVDTADIKDAAVTPAKLSTGHPTWDSSGNFLINASGTPAAGAKMKIATSSRTGAFVDFTATGGENWIIDSTNTTGSTDVLGIYANGATGMYLTDAGNVGIGTSSPAAANKLQVASSTADQGIAVGGTTKQLRFSYDTTSNYGQINCADWGTGQTDLSIGGLDLLFKTGIYSLVERMRIDSSGNVGVGTNSPNSWGKFVSSGSSPQVVAVGGSGQGGQVSILGNAATTNPFIIGQGFNTASDGVAYISNQANADMIFRTNAIERMRVDSSGNLLVNTTTAFSNAKFAVVGPDVVNKTIAAFYALGNGTTTSYNMMWFGYTGTGGSGAILANQNSVSMASISDYRQKTNIEPLGNALERVAALRPKRFNWVNIEEQHEKVDGFIAHEVQQVVPEAVFGEKDAVREDGSHQLQMMDASKIVPLLTAAIQEQQAIIEQLKSRIEILEAN